MKERIIENKKLIIIAAAVLFCLALLPSGREVRADEMISSPDVVEGVVFVEDVCVTGMTLEEVEQVIADKFFGFSESQIVINVRGNPVAVPASAFGLYYANTDLASYILKLQGRGNIWQRYKMERYVQDNGGLVFVLDLAVSEENVRNVILNQCSTLDIPRVDMRIERDEEGAFYATEKVNGIYTDVDTTTANLCHYMNEEWHGGAGLINAVLIEDPAAGDPDAVALMDSILGSGVTKFQVDEKNQYRNTNIAVATSKLNGSIVYPGEEFSTITPMMPFTEAEGYVRAPAYEQGEVVDDIGGGICQVSTTLYRAVLEAELEVVERNQHSMIVGYVDPSMDATISEGEKDFRFINNTDAPIFIEGYIVGDQLYFNIYGHETRPPERTIAFESEVTHFVPFENKFELDPDLDFGSIHYTDGHSEVDATAYKLVYVNGELESREPLTTSNYQRGDSVCYVGTKGASDEVVAALSQAVASADQETINNAILSAGGELKIVP